jgi:hypothetical protein
MVTRLAKLASLLILGGVLLFLQGVLRKRGA